MPKKRTSQPMQVWLASVDILRLQQAAKQHGRSQSEIAREGILRVLDELDKKAEEKAGWEKLVEKFSPAAQQTMALAVNEAKVTNSRLVGSEHLLLTLAATERTSMVLRKRGVSHSLVRHYINTGWPSTYVEVANHPYSPTLIRIVDRARLLAKRSVDRYVHPEHLLLSLIDQGTGFGFNILELILGRERTDLREALVKQIASSRLDQDWNWKRRSKQTRRSK